MNTEEAELWFNGPPFTHERIMKCEEAKFHTILDEKKHVMTAAVQVQEENEIVAKIEGYSTWTKSVRVIAYVTRVVQILYNLRARKSDPQMEKLTWNESLIVKECIQAENLILRLYQHQEFRTEIKEVREARNIKNGPLMNMAPFID